MWTAEPANVVSCAAGNRIAVRRPPGCQADSDPSAIRRRIVAGDSPDRLENSSIVSISEVVI